MSWIYLLKVELCLPKVELRTAICEAWTHDPGPETGGPWVQASQIQGVMCSSLAVPRGRQFKPRRSKGSSVQSSQIQGVVSSSLADPRGRQFNPRDLRDLNSWPLVSIHTHSTTHFPFVRNPLEFFILFNATKLLWDKRKKSQTMSIMDLILVHRHSHNIQTLL